MLYSISYMIYGLSCMAAGKEAMKEGPGAFNVVASERYKSLGSDERLSELREERRERVLNVKDVKREGAQVFRKIQSQVTGIHTGRGPHSKIPPPPPFNSINEIIISTVAAASNVS